MPFEPRLIIPVFCFPANKHAFTYIGIIPRGRDKLICHAKTQTDSTTFRNNIPAAVVFLVLPDFYRASSKSKDLFNMLLHLCPKPVLRQHVVDEFLKQLFF